MDPITKADTLCEHFSCVVSQAPQETPYSAFIETKCAFCEGEFSDHIADREVNQAISKLKIYLLGQIVFLINMHVHKLASLFNQSLLVGTVPKLWKTGFTIPLLKLCKINYDKKSYCPITLLSCIGKLL